MEELASILLKFHEDLHGVLAPKVLLMEQYNMSPPLVNFICYENSGKVAHQVQHLKPRVMLWFYWKTGHSKIAGTSCQMYQTAFP